MKVYLQGERTPRKSIPTERTYFNIKTNKIKVNKIEIGPHCGTCILSVLDMNNRKYCIRFDEDIAKFNDPNFNLKAEQLMKKYNCKIGDYILNPLII